MSNSIKNPEQSSAIRQGALWAEAETAFDNELYLAEQTAAIMRRVTDNSGKLYLEFGGKLIFDYHAARVLPGYDPNVKMRLLQRLKADTEIILCIYAVQKGVAAYEANDLSLAYKEFLASAEEGDAPSQFNVALMYEQGIGVAKNEKEAVAWYRKSALQGTAAAQFNLGVLYENGRGTKVDFAKANEWYRTASEQGDALAIGNLGMLYVRGQGVRENKVAGVALLLVSATRDSSPSNNAKNNISSTRGLTAKVITAAQTLSAEMTSGKNLLVLLDRFLENAERN